MQTSKGTKIVFNPMTIENTVFDTVFICIMLKILLAKLGYI